MKNKKLIIKDVQGEIYVISQDGSIKMLKDGDEIYADQKIFTKNLDAKITLEDGEQVNLSAHQSINLDEILKISAKETQEQSDHSNGFGASEDISLSAASFITSGHSANIHQIYNHHRSLETNISSAQPAQLKGTSGASSLASSTQGEKGSATEESFIDSTNKIMVVNKGLDSNISSAQPSELKSVSGASSTLVEKSGGAAEPKEEPFIDTINVLKNVTNRGLDADIWLYDSVRNHGRGLDYYDIEHNSKSILKEWSASHHVSATSTFNDLYYYSGKQFDPGSFDTSDSAKASRLRDRTPTAMELAKIGRAPNADYAIDRIATNLTFEPKNLNGHYKLYESKITADGVMVSMDGWIFIKNRSDINNFYYDEKPERQSMKFEFDGREISWQPFASASKNGGRDEGGIIQGVSTSSLNLTEDYGFYKVHIEVSDERYSYSFIAFSGINKIISKDPNIKLVSNAYMEALEHNHLVTKESDTFYKAANKPDGTIFGSNASDFDKPFDLKFEGTKDVGSNDDDKFIFNSHDIDAKGGIDTLLFTQNVDLTKISELDKRLESFERIELDSTKAVKLKLNGQNISDMIDSNPTADAHGKVSLNTILKISGDSDDVVQLVGNFIKATNGEVAALNAKNSVIGADDYNKLDEVGGKAVNQVYRGENNAGQTFFVEIDKNVHVEVM